MANVFTNVGEFRSGKGNRKTRLGPRIIIKANTKYGGEKKVQSPDDIAINKLSKIFDDLNVPKKDKRSYIDLMRRGEQIRFMNMQVLAVVLVYMNDIGGIVNSDNFTYMSISSYIDRLLPHREVVEGGTRTKEIPEDELQINRLRMAATFFRYIKYILLLRDQATQELEQAEQG
jgi:hypothetical protein